MFRALIPIILLFIALWGIGEFKIQLWPFRIYLEKGYQIFGFILIAIGIILIRYQERKDTIKDFVEEATEAVEQSVEQPKNIM